MPLKLIGAVELFFHGASPPCPPVLVENWLLSVALSFWKRRQIVAVNPWTGILA